MRESDHDTTMMKWAMADLIDLNFAAARKWFSPVDFQVPANFDQVPQQEFASAVCPF